MLMPKLCCIRNVMLTLCIIMVITGLRFYLGMDIRTPLIKELKDDHKLQTKYESTGTYDTNQGSIILSSQFFESERKDNRIDGNIVAKDQDFAGTTTMMETKKYKQRRNVDHAKNMTDKVKIINTFPLFQSIEELEFPSTDDKESRIPHIIHQMYANEMIPAQYENLVKSFIKYNPTWEYRFWTDESGRKLLQKHHPYLLKEYDSFGNSVRRSDMLRYAVLYEFGGFYADFDMENFRSLNRTTFKYACIFPAEPFEHSALLDNQPFLINNAFMGCRPNHPFLKLLLSDLRGVAPDKYPVQSTGPGYVTRIFIKYNRITSDKYKTDWSSNSPYFYKGEINETDNNTVYVPNSQYFMDKIDPIHLHQSGKFTIKCNIINMKSLSYLQKRACIELSSRKQVRRNRKFTYTVHHWYHLWHHKKETLDQLKKINISKLVPYYTQYHGE